MSENWRKIGYKKRSMGVEWDSASVYRQRSMLQQFYMTKKALSIKRSGVEWFRSWVMLWLFIDYSFQWPFFHVKSEPRKCFQLNETFFLPLSDVETSIHGQKVMEVYTPGTGFNCWWCWFLAVCCVVFVTRRFYSSVLIRGSRLLLSSSRGKVEGKKIKTKSAPNYKRRFQRKSC
jgi:hypothetical protein